MHEQLHHELERIVAADLLVREALSGSEADLIADFRALKKMGVGAIDIDFGRPTADAMLAEMKRFRAAVIEKI